MKTTSGLATAQGSSLTNYRKTQFFLLRTRTMEQNRLFNKPFKQTFRITDIKHIIIRIPFITKYIPTIKSLSTRTNKQPPFFSKFYPIYNQTRKHLKPLAGYVYNFSIKPVHQYDKAQNKQRLHMSDHEFGQIQKFFEVTILSINYMKTSNSDMISLHVYNNSPYKLTLPLGLLG